MQHNKHDVFISYSRKDLALVRRVKDEIEGSTSIRCWMDLNGTKNGIESGSYSFNEAIVNAIGNCSIFLFMLSENSQESQNAIRELNYAYDEKDKLGIHVVIVNIDNCQINNKLFKLLFSLADIISWNDISQHDKLLSDIIVWKDSIKTKEDLFARKIANLYLDKYPRINSYGVEVVSSEDDSFGTYYHKLSSVEFEILQRFVNRPEDECDIGLSEWLESEQQNDLIDKLLDFYSPYQLDILNDIDLDHPLKFSRFVLRYQLSDGTFTNPFYISVALTDDEYVDILTDLLKLGNHYSLNMMVYKRPEIAQRIMSHIVDTFLDGIGIFAEPFLCDLYELKSVARSILDPFEDKLQLFESEDEDLLRFVIKRQIEPVGAGEEIFSEYTEDDRFHCVLNFEGPYMLLTQEGIKGFDDWYDVDSFKYDARVALKKFGLEKPDELFTYLKAHYNFRECLSRIREFLENN